MGMIAIGLMGILMEIIVRAVERHVLVWYHGAGRD
jgi:ABC-type nitrate/sulfonate/bicarbonate transport system permease component